MAQSLHAQPLAGRYVGWITSYIEAAAGPRRDSMSTEVSGMVRVIEVSESASSKEPISKI